LNRNTICIHSLCVHLFFNTIRYKGQSTLQISSCFLLIDYLI